MAAPAEAEPDREQAERQDVRRRYSRGAAGSEPEGLRRHHRRRSRSDPPRSQLSADGCRAVARNADGAGDRREVPPHRRSFPSGEGRQRNRVRAPGAAGRLGHCRAPGALARGTPRIRAWGGRAVRPRALKCRYLPTPAVATVCSAIISSSLVGITKTMVGEFPALIICALARFAWRSKWTPIHSVSLRAASRTFHE